MARLWTRLLLPCGLALVMSGCSWPQPPATNLPTLPAVLDITPAPTLDIDATATTFAQQLRPTPTPAGLYIVQQGDTLSSIALRFDTSVEELLASNGLTDANALQVGQALIIPSLLRTPVVGTPDPNQTPAITPVVTTTVTGTTTPTPGTP